MSHRSVLVPAAAVGRVTHRRRVWLVAAPAVAIAVVFGLSMRGTLDRRGRGRLRWLFDPAGARRRSLARQLAALRADGGRFTVLAPCDWDGPVDLIAVSAGDKGDGPPALEQVTVMATTKDGRDRHRSLKITLRRAADPYAETLAAARLVFEDRSGPPPHSDPPDLGERIRALGETWREARMLIEGDQVPVRLLVGVRSQVALFEIDGEAVEIVARDIDLDGYAMRRVHRT